MSSPAVQTQDIKSVSEQTQLKPALIGRYQWILTGNLWAASWKLALPMMGQALLQSLFALVDMKFVGLLPGTAAVAAVGIAGQLMGFVFMAAMGITTGLTALVAQSVGRGDLSSANRVVGQAIIMMAVLSAIFLCLAPFSNHAMIWMGVEPGTEIYKAGQQFLPIICAGSFGMLFTTTFAAALRGSGDAVTPLILIGAANVLNILLDWALIFGKGPFPAMGIAGSACATTTTNILVAAAMAYTFFKGRHEHFHLQKRHFRPHVRMIWQMFKMGVFSSAQMLIWNVSGLLLYSLVNTFGTASVAAYTIGNTLRMAAVVPGLGFGNAAATLTGQNIGAGNVQRAARAAWVVTALYTAVSLAVAGLFYFGDEFLMWRFKADPAVIPTGAIFMRWLALSFVFVGPAVTLARAMNGAGDTFWPMLLTAITVLGMRLPLAYWLAGKWHSEVGVWAAFSLSLCAQGLLHLFAFMCGRWKTIGLRYARAGV